MNTILALCYRNIKAYLRNKIQVVSSLVFPFFFIYIFSSVFQDEHVKNPVTYMLAGVLISTVFDFSIRISSSTIDDMASGFMKEVLVSPASRLSIAAGQFLSSAIISTIQGLVILVVGFIFGYRVSSPLTIMYCILVMIFVGFVFAGFGLFLATSTKNTQTFQVVSMAITMPMTFISGAYIPLSKLPTLLEYIGRFNPMTYAVNFFKAIALERMGQPNEVLINEGLAFKIGDFVFTPYIAMLILLAFGILFLVLSTLSFVNCDFSKMNRNKNDSVEW